MEIGIIIAIGFLGLIILSFLWAISRYRRCPSDKILVIYGKTGGGSARCLAGGAAFVWPVIQDYQYLDLTPISIDVDLRGALSKQNIRVNVPSRFTVGISNQEGTMLNAAERLLGKNQDQIRDIAKDIIFGQLRLVVATMDIEEINSDRDKFLTNVAKNVGAELSKIGLSLINVNVTDIQDESGYIEALGKEAAAKAINDAKMSVAEKNRDGSIGEANANRDKRIQVSSADADAQIGEADADAKSINGANEAKIKIAKSNAERQVKEAEALRLATTAEQIQK
ncbi:MAG: flotillin, partial [Saprospiraceae bacterium]